MLPPKNNTQEMPLLGLSAVCCLQYTAAASRIRPRKVHALKVKLKPVLKHLLYAHRVHTGGPLIKAHLPFWAHAHAFERRGKNVSVLTFQVADREATLGLQAVKVGQSTSLLGWQDDMSADPAASPARCDLVSAA